MKEENTNEPKPIYFSKALEKTGFGLFNYSLILLGGLMMWCIFYETAGIGFILPIAECDLQLTNPDKGVLSSVGYIGNIVSSHLWGFLVDTRGRRAVIMPTLFISSAVSILSSFANRFWFLVVLRFINGFFICASTTFFVYIGEFHIGRTRTATIMACSCIYSIGTMLLPAISWVILMQNWSFPLPLLGIVYKPWRLLILVCGIPGIVAGLILLLFPESPKFLLSIGKQEEAIKILKKMYALNVRHGNLQINEIIPDNDTIVQNVNEPSFKNFSLLRVFLLTLWKQTVPLFEKSLLLSTVLVCTMQFWIFVTVCGVYMWYPFISDTMLSFMSQNSTNTTRICDAVQANQVEHNIVDTVTHCTEQLQDRTFIHSIGTEFCVGLGFLVIGVLSRKVQKNYILLVLLLITGICGLMTNLTYNTTLALIAFNMLFLSGIAIQVVNAITIELFPTHLRGMALSISLMFGRIGGVAGANIIGLLLANNCDMTFYIAGSGLLASAFLTFLIPKIKHAGDEESVISSGPTN